MTNKRKLAKKENKYGIYAKTEKSEN